MQHTNDIRPKPLWDLRDRSAYNTPNISQFKNEFLNNVCIANVLFSRTNDVLPVRQLYTFVAEIEWTSSPTRLQHLWTMYI